KLPWTCTCHRSQLTVSCCHIIFFFFSSRRRHTRCYRDWSSDVCSSDLFRVPRSQSSRSTQPERQRQHSLGSTRPRCQSLRVREEDRKSVVWERVENAVDAGSWKE